MTQAPRLPYYAVIFLIVPTNPDDEAFNLMAARMDELCAQQPGFLGMDYAEGEAGITICYWESLEAIKAWKANVEHLEAQRRGREQWFSKYRIRICKVEEDYGIG